MTRFVHLHPGFAHLQGKSGAKLPWVLHLSETIHTSESKSGLRLKTSWLHRVHRVKVALWRGADARWLEERVKRQKTAVLFLKILDFC